MWNLRFQLPFTSRPDGSDAADPIDPEFDALINGALDEAHAPDALRARVAETCRAGLQASRGERPRMPLGKLGYAIAAGTMLLVVAPFLTGRNRGGAALADSAPTPGQLAVVDGKGRPTALCPLRHTDVHADVQGYVARVTVEQRFHNPSTTPVEAVYTFPLPEDAAVDDMTIRVGDRIVVGEIKRREEAREIYEQAREAGQTAALLDQERPNIFTQSVANLMPGTDVVVHISYVNLLKYDGGGYELVYPMVVGPRFVPGSGGYQAPGLRGDPSPARRVDPNPGTTPVVTDAEKITPPIAPPNTRAGHDISVTVSLDAGLPIEGVESTLHAVDVERPAPDRAVVRLKDQNTIPNKDFILRYTVAGKEIRSAVLANQTKDGSGYFTLMVQPPAGEPTARPDARELVFVIDQTGSQSGWPIQKAKETMRYLIRNMNPGDTFQLLGFNTDVYPCFPEPVHNTPENVARAQRFLEALEAEGGTDILKAADYALTMPGEAGRRRLICYLTDGYVGDDMQIVDYVRKHRDRAYMFPFGIGNSVNRFLLEGMAREGQGSAEFVTLQSSAEEAAARFYRRVARPLVTHLRVEWNGLPVRDVLPARVPDLFVDGRPVILKGRYTRAAEGELVLRGEVDGRPWSHTMRVSLPAVQADNSPLPTLWAREKIEQLQASDYLGIQTGNPDEQIREQVIGLALDYRLMSQYTSFVTVEKRVVNVGGKQRTVDVPVEMPEGVLHRGIFGEAGGEMEDRLDAVKLKVPQILEPVPAPPGEQPVAASETEAGSGGHPASPPVNNPPPAAGAAVARSQPQRSVPVPSPSLPTAATAPARPTLARTMPKPKPRRYRNPFSEVGELKGMPVIVEEPEQETAGQLDETTAVEKLAPVLRRLATGGSLRSGLTGAPAVQAGRTDVLIWLTALPPDGMRVLKELGFELAAELRPGKLLLGTVPVAKLRALAELTWVRRIEPPDYR